MPRRIRTVAEKVEDFLTMWALDEVTGCELWTKGTTTPKTNDGSPGITRGILTWEGTTVYAHRLKYALDHNIPLELLEGVVIRHTCDNGLCGKKEHLIAGTQGQNIQDCIDRKRRVFKRGPNKLNAPKVLAIRRLLLRGLMSQVAIGRLFGVSFKTINDIATGHRWAHVQLSEEERLAILSEL